MKVYISKKGPLSRSTTKAYAFERRGKQRDMWLPKSQVTVKKADEKFEIQVPKWLVKSKGHNNLMNLL